MAQEVDAGSRQRTALWRSVLPAVVYLVVSVWATWPLARVAGTDMVSHFSPEDVLLDLWTLSWDVHALAHQPARLFRANIFHPLGNALTLSEHLLGHLPIFAPVWVVTKNAVLGLNLVVFASFWLSGFFMHLLIDRWTGSTAAAYTAGLAFAFAPWRLSNFQTPHQLCVQYFPLILLTLDWAAVSGRVKIGLLAAGVITLQLLCSYYLAYITLVIVGCYLVALLIADGRRLREAWPALACAVILPPLLLVPLSLPYVGAITSSMRQYLGGNLIARVAAKLTPPSIVVGYYVGQGIAVLAALLPFAWLVTRHRVETRTWLRLFCLLLLVGAGFTISPGPAGMLNGWIAPYAWLSAVIPGFSLVRVPGRFAVLASLGASALAGFTVVHALGAVEGERRRALVSLAIVAVVGAVVWWQGSSYPFRLKTFPLPTSVAQVPPVYRWLADHGEGKPLLELEVQKGSGNVAWCAWRGEAMAMYYSTFHWLPILNGYSGYQPPSYGVIQEQATQLPDRAALQTLADCAGLSWILVHRSNSVPEPRWRSTDDLREVATFPNGSGQDYLYEVQLSPHSSCPLDLTGGSRD